MKTRLVVIFLLAAPALLQAQNVLESRVSATVFVPGNASGGFGNPATGYVPMVRALNVTRRGTIEIDYVSGRVSDAGGVSAGPNGVSWTEDAQSPLQEAVGIKGGTIPNLNALIAVFIPRSVVLAGGFSPVDGTKALASVGIPPSELRFVGRYGTIEASGPGTVFLGINDWVVGDNGGGFTVRVTGP